MTIVYSFSPKLFKEWECLGSSFNVQCLFYPAFLLLASSPPCVLCHCPSHYHPVAFQGRCAQVFPICNNRKLIHPHFQQKMWPISIHPCQYIQLQNAQIKLSFRHQLDACRKKKHVRSCAFVLRWRYCISRAYQVNYQSQGKWPNRYSQR